MKLQPLVEAMLEMMINVACKLQRLEERLLEPMSYRRPPDGDHPRPPRLLGNNLLKWVLGASDFKKIVEPQIADMQAEVEDLRRRACRGGIKRALWRGHWCAIASTVRALGARMVSQVTKRMRA